jgi:hypothetical protein
VNREGEVGERVSAIGDVLYCARVGAVGAEVVMVVVVYSVYVCSCM